jgi:hypothetical protein
MLAIVIIYCPVKVVCPGNAQIPVYFIVPVRTIVMTDVQEQTALLSTENDDAAFNVATFLEMLL